MSTRAQIHVEGTGVFIYKHSDGYPDGNSGVMAVLEPFVQGFVKDRGWDPEYLAAQIVRAFATADAAEALTRLNEPERYDGMFKMYGEHHRLLGWGLGTQLHGDEEYIYVVTEKTIEVRVPKNRKFSDSPALNLTKVERTIPTEER